MDFLCARADDMPTPLYQSLAGYRYQVFVETLRWDLRCEAGYEQDQFDHADTVHVVARNEQGQIVGCGRLLPSTGPYLLESVFPALLNGIEVPRSEQIWELSRFAAMDFQRDAAQEHLAERVLLEALRFCSTRGVTHLLAVSTPPVERLLRRAGVECQRLGPPIMAQGSPIVAFVISVSAVSIDALTVIEASVLQRQPVRRAPRVEVSDVLQTLAALVHEARPVRTSAPFAAHVACEPALH